MGIIYDNGATQYPVNGPADWPAHRVGVDLRREMGHVVSDPDVAEAAHAAHQAEHAALYAAIRAVAPTAEDDGIIAPEGPMLSRPPFTPDAPKHRLSALAYLAQTVQRTFLELTEDQTLTPADALGLRIMGAICRTLPRPDASPATVAGAIVQAMRREGD